MELKHFSASMSSTVEDRKADGKTWAVVPAVMVREGVLNGELITAGVLASTLAGDADDEAGTLGNQWEGLPVTIGHPEIAETVTDSLAAVEAARVGEIRNARLDGADLAAELWIDPEAKAAAEALDLMRAGTMLDVSIGVYELARPALGSVNGRDYSVAVTAMAPNHVAILPRQRGACSLDDGCGTPRGRRFAAAEARRPTFQGAENSPWNVTRADFSGMEPEKIAGHTLLGDRETPLVLPVVNPRTGRLNLQALLNALGGRAARVAASEDAKRSARRMALELLDGFFGVPVDPAAAESKPGSSILSRIKAAAAAACGCGKTNHQQEMDNMADKAEQAAAEERGHAESPPERDDIRAVIREEIRAALNEERATRESAERDQLVAKLSGKAMGLADDVLRGLPVDSLRGMVAALKPAQVDYSAAAGENRAAATGFDWGSIPTPAFGGRAKQ